MCAKRIFRKDQTPEQLAAQHLRNIEAKKRWYQRKQALKGKVVTPRVPSTLTKQEKVAIYNRKQRERRKSLGITTKSVYKRKTVKEKPGRKPGVKIPGAVKKAVKPALPIMENRIDNRTVEVVISPKLKIMVAPGTDIDKIRKKYANK